MRCPYCGGNPRLKVTEEGYTLRCGKHSLAIYPRHTIAEAIKAWKDLTRFVVNYKELWRMEFTIKTFGICDRDIQIFDEACPKCGAIMYYRECPECEDGFVCYDDDPINYSTGEEEEDCPACNGYGRHIWCRKCGWDFLEEQYLNGKSDA